MEWIIVALVAGAALICPAMMFGPMLLHRLGLRKGSGASMSCMGMSHEDQAATQDLAQLRSRRAELDREIAGLERDAASRRRHETEVV